MKLIVYKILFCFSCFYEQLNLSKTIIFRREFSLSFSHHVNIILGLFCNSIALILGLNSVKDLRVTKNVKEIKFEGVWGELEAKKVSRDNNTQNI